MNVVWHQTERVNLHCQKVPECLHVGEIRIEIGIRIENDIAVVPTMHDMVREIWKDNPVLPCHEVKLWPVGKKGHQPAGIGFLPANWML